MILNIIIICTKSTCADYESKQKNESLSPLHMHQSGCMFLHKRSMHFQDCNFRNAALGTSVFHDSGTLHLTFHSRFHGQKLSSIQDRRLKFFGAVLDSGKSYVCEMISKCLVWTIMFFFPLFFKKMRITIEEGRKSEKVRHMLYGVPLPILCLSFI